MSKVYTDLDICFTQVKSYNYVKHLSISEAQVQQDNKITATVAYDWNLEIDNNALTSDRTILAAIQALS